MATQIPASGATTNNYAFNGKQFVWVKNALNIGANKAWLEVATGNATARTLKLVFGESTGVNEVIEVNGVLGEPSDQGRAIDNSWYDLNGRKLQGIPTKRSAEGRLYPQGLKKGVYIFNGKKVVVK